ncbi:MAG: hypothetical protein NT154_15125 [Verrucomicrobia bacterium]|nr:hypothetical protein [Verrucomicrobiota bacterium]
MKKILSILIMLAFTVNLQAGLIFADPVELSLTGEKNLFSDDEVHIVPTGKHGDCFVFNIDCTLELTYSTGVRKLHVERSSFSKKDPLTVSIPDGWNKRLQSVRLKGKCGFLAYMKPRAEWSKLPPNPTESQIIKAGSKVMTGYKIDSAWTFR